jgi:alpha-mannosidase
MCHKGTLPAEHSFMEVSPSNVILSTLKMEAGYNERDLIIRLYECQGRRTEARISFPWPVTAEERDLIERPVPNPALIESAGTTNEIAVPLGPWEVKTMRIVRKQ